jgi:hypothetical protein
MTFNVSPDLSRLIAHELSLGRYGSEEELLTEAVHLLSERNALREHIDAGVNQLASGEFTDYDSHSLRQRFNDLKADKRFNQ